MVVVSLTHCTTLCGWCKSDTKHILLSDLFGCFFPWQCKLYHNSCSNVLLWQPKQHTTITTMTMTTDLANNSDHLQTTNSCLSLSPCQCENGMPSSGTRWTQCNCLTWLANKGQCGGQTVAVAAVSTRICAPTCGKWVHVVFVGTKSKLVGQMRQTDRQTNSPAQLGHTLH
jgi:hypothetical protein